MSDSPSAGNRHLGCCQSVQVSKASSHSALVLTICSVPTSFQQAYLSPGSYAPSWCFRPSRNIAYFTPKNVSFYYQRHPVTRRGCRPLTRSRCRSSRRACRQDCTRHPTVFVLAEISLSSTQKVFVFFIKGIQTVFRETSASVFKSNKMLFWILCSRKGFFR